jgi:hypothetical protein
MGGRQMPKSKKRCHRAQPYTLTAREGELLKHWEVARGLAPKLTALLEDCSLSSVYERLASGEYDAYKDGNRTKVTVESIKRRRDGLPRAGYKPHKSAVELQP